MDSSFIFMLFLALQQVLIMKGFESSDHGQTSTQLLFKLGTPCTYSYQVAVHTARGSKSTASQGYEVYTLVRKSLLFQLFQFSNDITYNEHF
jgi:hypothetical protein